MAVTVWIMSRYDSMCEDYEINHVSSNYEKMSKDYYEMKAAIKSDCEDWEVVKETDYDFLKQIVLRKGRKTIILRLDEREVRE